jgi:hypothetical protein
MQLNTLNRDTEHCHLDEIEYAIMFLDTTGFLRDKSGRVAIFDCGQKAIQMKREQTRPCKIVERKKYPL